MKITLNEWNYTCGDGCCYDYGTNLIIDGEDLGSYSSEEELIQKLVLYLSPNIESIEIESTLDGDEYE